MTKPTRTRSRTSMGSSSPASDSLEGFAAFCRLLVLEDGSPFELHDFQRRMVSDYFGGARETLVLVSKKNGKSTLLSALALHHLLVTRDAECVIAAAARDQAEILLRQAQGFIRRSPGLADRLTVQARTILGTGSGRIRILASDAQTADGVIPTLALVDELHRHRSADMYGVFRDGLGPRQGRMITISTAGDDDMSPLGLMRRAAYKLPGLTRDGAYRYARSENGEYVMHEWALEPTDDRNDIGLVKLANPAPWQTEDALRQRKDSPSMTAAQWARFACGVWMREEDSAISAVEWADCAREYPGIPDGADIRIGVDLGWKWDTTAIVPHYLTDDGTAVVGDPVIVTPPRDGNSTPKDRLLAPILELARQFNVRAIVLDPEADGEIFAQDLEAHDFTVIAHSQKPQTMALAAERLMTAVRERTIRHPDHPEFNAHVLNAALKSAAGEQYRFVKPKSKRPIDGVIALAMVHSVAVGGDETQEPFFAWA